MAARYDWSSAKDLTNRSKHGIGFDAIFDFDWDTADVEVDDREDYGELRERAIGSLRSALVVLIFTVREDEDGDYIWVISLRRATPRERTRYAGQP